MLLVACYVFPAAWFSELRVSLILSTMQVVVVWVVCFHFSFPHKSNIGQRNQDPHNHYKALCVLEVALKYKEKLPARKLLSFSTTYTVIKT